MLTVKLSKIGLIDPDIPGSRQDLSPSSCGSTGRVSVNLTMPDGLLDGLYKLRVVAPQGSWTVV